MKKQTLKAGTKIVLHGSPSIGGFAAVAPEHATIGRWIRKINGPIVNHAGYSLTNSGWHIVVFKDGGKLLIHESRFDVIK